MQEQTYWLVVKHDTEFLFNLHGPMPGNKPKERVIGLLSSDFFDGTLSKDDVINEMKQRGYKLTEDIFMIVPKMDFLEFTK